MRDSRLTAFARANRKAPTPAEQKLWFALRAKRFEALKFRRQKVIGPYIVDFAARAPMLVIEIDGDSHATQERYDAERTRYLEEQGYQVIRFTNAQVMENLEGVLLTIAAAVGGTSPLQTLSAERARAI
ncbi:MAG: hypothetical protein A4S12_06120 [Proteobacteria bacterium SG_bin5]|nr:endonuclease domain-containing protein [Sphingomonas sp.]OQW43041.1 MAG: hypothetical protein A4S12_06120 [Proteobacteria bacterium SG_bin5]